MSRIADRVEESGTTTTHHAGAELVHSVVSVSVTRSAVAAIEFLVFTETQ